MPNLEYRLVFDAHDRASVKHVMVINGPRVALCKDPLTPWANQRMSDGRSRMESEASCPDCMNVLASRIATVAHHGQIDQDGKPHTEHVNRVLVAVAGHEDWQVAVVAKLHDVVTDSAFTERSLREHFFPSDIAEAIWMISRLTVLPHYHTFLGRVGSETAGLAGKWARVVMLAHATDEYRRASAGFGVPSQPQQDEMVKWQTIREQVVAAMHNYREVTLQFRESVAADKFTIDPTRVPGHILNEA